MKIQWRHGDMFCLFTFREAAWCGGGGKGDWKKPLDVAAALTSPPFVVTNLQNGSILRPTPGLLVRKLLIIMTEETAYHHDWHYTAAAAAKSPQSCPTLCDPRDGSPPGSAVLGFSRQEHWSGLPFPSPMHESEKWKWSRSGASDS